MLRLSELLNREGATLVDDLRLALEKDGRNASGETSKSIEALVIEEDNGVTKLQILANENILALENGRNPTESGGNGDLLEKIKEWLKVKPFDRDIDDETLAYMITAKIHKEGYAGTPGLLSDVLSNERINTIGNEISNTQTMEFNLIIDQFIDKQKLGKTLFKIYG